MGEKLSVYSGKHYKESFLEKDHPSKDLREGSKPTEPRGKEEEEDRVLMQLKKIQAHVSVWVCSWPLKSIVRLSWTP